MFSSHRIILYIALLLNITSAADPIFGLCNTTAGSASQFSSTGGSSCQYTSGEEPINAVDYDTSTKYVSYGNGGNSLTSGVNTGFYIRPRQYPSLVTSFQFTTASDANARDPLAMTLEGANATGGNLWTLIYNGVTGCTTDPGRSAYCPIQSVTNTVYYMNYRVLILAQRGTANSVQYSEMHLFGYL